MNDRDSETRAYALKDPVNGRMRREKQRKRRQLVLITLLSLIALSLIITAVVICGELVGSGNKDPEPATTTDPGEATTDAGELTAALPGPDETDEQTGAETTDESTGGLPEGYTVKLMTAEDVHRGELILVNTAYRYVTPTTTTGLINLRDNRNAKWGTSPTGKTVYSFSCATNILLTANTVLNLNNMIDDFYTATQNQDVYFPENSGYRSYTTQGSLYEAKPSRECPAGCSEHETGLSVDVRAWLDNGTFPYISESSDASCVQIYNWINQNCYKYGFIQRYPESKASTTKSSHYAEHYRYVGYPHALAMMRNDLCLEEYLAVLAARHSYSDTHYVINGEDGVTYEIYYVPAETADGAVTSVPVPTSLPYTVSGNNYDGFIVTVTKN